MQRTHLARYRCRTRSPPTPRSFHPRFTLRITLQLVLANRCSRLGCRPQHARKQTLIVGFPSIISSPLLLFSPPLLFSRTPWGAIERSKPQHETRAWLFCIVQGCGKEEGEIVGGYVAHRQDWTDWIERLCLQIWCIFNVITTREHSACTCWQFDRSISPSCDSYS